MVVLAHADGWGALSANKMLKALHEDYPNLGVHLVVSQATKNAEGKIATKLEDLKTPRELKETNLLQYFARVDKLYDKWPSDKEVDALYAAQKAPPQLEGLSPVKQMQYMQELGKWHATGQPQASLLTFQQLARKYTADGEVHYTTRGGPKGGEEAAAVVAELEKRHGKGPEVLLSLDTMAILPAHLLERYQCFSCHPGPLDSIKVEGMQGTLRSLANNVFYDADGNPMPPKRHPLEGGLQHVKGTLFLQHPELDKGPPIRTALTPVVPGMCAYRVRDDIYWALTDEMLSVLPTLLDKDARTKLVADATHTKEQADAHPHTRIGELEAEQLASWQGKAVGWPVSAHKLHVAQNEILDPAYFKGQMRRYFPGSDQQFVHAYKATFGAAQGKMAAQTDERLEDPWARYYAGKPGVMIRQQDFTTGRVTVYSTKPKPKDDDRSR